MISIWVRKLIHLTPLPPNFENPNTQVINFFEGPLGLITPDDSRYGSGGVTRRQLMNIPILLVGMEAMNENVKHRPSGAHDPSGAVTGGMCLSERIRPIGSGGGGGGKGFGVTAILCLSGLPADLTASILAHGELLHGIDPTKHSVI